MKIVAYNETDGTFNTVLDSIKTRLAARLAGTDNLCSPQQTPLLKQAAFSCFLSRTETPVNFTYLAFAFKKKKDPANLYPLRYIRGVTAGRQQFFVGSEAKNKDTDAQLELKLTDISSIQKITTFFASPKETSGKLKERYKTRIIAFIINYTGTDSQQHETLICAASSEFAKFRDSSTIRDDCLEYLDTYARANPAYFIAFEENSDGLNFYPDQSNPQKRVQITNIGYDLVSGASKQYIANFALISTLPMQMSDLVPDTIKKIQCEMPFQINSTGEKIVLEIESSRSEGSRNVVATQKTHNFSVSIPQISVGMPQGPSVAIGQMAGYNYSNTHGIEQEETASKSDRFKINMTIQPTAYVLENLQSSNGFQATNLVKLMNSASETVLEVSVPTNVPCFNVTDDNALVTQVIGAI